MRVRRWIIAVYYSTQNIAWLRNANVAATNAFGVSGIDPGGITPVWGANFQSATQSCIARYCSPAPGYGYCVQFTTSSVPGDAYSFLVRPLGASYNPCDSTSAASRDAGINAAPGSYPSRIQPQGGTE